LQRLQSLSARTRRAKLRKEVTGRLKSEFIESDGVLVRDSADENETWYGFLHLTFQEYLAARALAEEPAEIARRVRADHQKWWVMALLAGSKLVTHNDGSVWKLLKALCPQDCNDAARKQAADADYRLAWLAGEIVLENNLNAEGGTRSAEGRARHSGRAGRRAEDSPPYHEGEPLERIKSWLAALGDFQPFRARERALAGVVLGRLGDPRKGVGLFTEGPAKDLPEMDWIKIETPESGFIMGEHFDAPFHQKYHGGGRMQCHLLDLKSYYLSRYPVTVLQFAAFTKDKGYQIQDWWTDAGWRWKEKHVVTGTEQDRYYRGVLFTPNYPIVGVSWYEAVAYSRWLTYRLRFAQLMGDDEEIALPSEAQWERAARGLYGARYQWGDSAEDMYEKCNGCRIDSDSTSAVGIFPVDPQICEARDMTGNVQQWCRTKYATSYYEHYQPDDAIEGGDSRVVKGGSWECVRIVPPDMLSSARFSHVPSRRENDIGFRLVRAKFGPSH
jgi:formylglycine-generating enzyme required for sulfatase activity